MAASLPFAALPVCPVLDARKGEVYASLYRWDGRAMRREWEYQALTPEALAARLGEPVILLGDGAAAIRSPHARPAPPSHRAPSPVWVALLGVERLRAAVAIITTPVRTPSSWRPAWTGRAARPRRPGTR